MMAKGSDTLNSERLTDVCLDEINENKFINNNCITGDKDFLLNRLKVSFKKAKSIDIIVSFLMESGVKLLKNELKEVLNKKIPIRILTGNYLNITQPQALYMLKDILGEHVDLRFYNVKNKSFHPKAYIFHYEDDGEIFIGSSNMSCSALTYGIEWNYKIIKNKNKDDFNHFYGVFEDLFLNHSIIVDENELKRYSQNWIRPKVFKDIEKTSLNNNIEDDETVSSVIPMFEPRGAQMEALYELKKSREENFDKALIVAATGVGKTYLAAFDSRKFKRVLFIAHREEIIKQAATSFKNVRPNDSTGFFYSDTKEINKDLIFALVQTLGKEEYLNEKYFKEDYFDYIVIDEFHHATANNYKNILDYFKPKFLLGLTATPERLDNKDVFSLCDYNTVYEVRLREAINKGWLVPFRYYGIYDDTVNYDDIEYKKGKYNEKALEKALTLSKRAELILKNYEKYKSERALGFCSSKHHAEYMAKYFSTHGIEAAAVYSKSTSFNKDTSIKNTVEFKEIIHEKELSKEEKVNYYDIDKEILKENNSYWMDRNEAITKLTKGEINIIFSVDMFNEGLDIPSVDLVMFLRPTESPTVFLQQLGRGLRKFKGKNYLNVLDFIGNYKKANLIPFFLTGKSNVNTSTNSTNKTSNANIDSQDYPEDCIVDFDFRLIDIFKKQEREQLKLQEIIKEEFYRIKDDLNHRPSRLEFFTYIDDSVYENMRSKSKFNVFNDYINFLKSLNELKEEEKFLENVSLAYKFINMLETTSMSKTYKIPVLLSFYNKGDIKFSISDDYIYNVFKEFYAEGSNSVDLLRHKNTKDFKSWNKDKYLKLAKDNPIKFLNKTHGDFFSINKDLFCLNEELKIYKDNASFKEHFKDVIDYRTKQYYKNRFKNGK